MTPDPLQSGFCLWICLGGTVFSRLLPLGSLQIQWHFPFLFQGLPAFFPGSSSISRTTFSVLFNPSYSCLHSKYQDSENLHSASLSHSPHLFSKWGNISFPPCSYSHGRCTLPISLFTLLKWFSRCAWGKEGEIWGRDMLGQEEKEEMSPWSHFYFQGNHSISVVLH